MTRKDGLPRRVYVKHGAYYFVTPANQWKKLCRVKDGLPSMFRALAVLSEAEAISDRMPAVLTRYVDSKKAEWGDRMVKDQERIANYMAEAFAEFTPAEVTTPVCVKYLQEFASQARTHNMHRTMLRQVMAFAAREGLREGHNPIDNVPTKATPGRIRVVLDSEILAIKKACSGFRSGRPLAQMMDLALLTGQRIGDLIKLRWQDVTDDGLYFEQGKGGRRVKLLVEWTPALRAAIKACEKGDRIGHVLKTQTGTGFRYAGIRSAWVRACERAKIEDMNIHDMRGRAGVDALGDNEDIQSAQRLLGHKGERMTRHYVDGKYARKVKPTR